MNVKVKDLTSEELKSLIQETVEEAMLELLGDPDRGLRLAEDVKKRLQISLEHLQQGEPLVPAQPGSQPGSGLANQHSCR